MCTKLQLTIFIRILLQMVTARGRKLPIAIPSLLIMTILICLLFLGRRILVLLINGNLLWIVNRAIFMSLLMPGESLVDLNRQLFYVIHAEIGYGLLAFALGQLSQACNSNQECCLAHALLMLFREQLKEVANCN